MNIKMEGTWTLGCVDTFTDCYPTHRNKFNMCNKVQTNLPPSNWTNSIINININYYY